MRSLLCLMRWWIRDYDTVAFPMVNASDVGDKVEGRMGLLRSFRAAMNEIFATICARDQLEKRAAAELREMMDQALTMCVDLFAWAPYWVASPPENPAAAWEEMQKRSDPYFYVVPLIDEALPVMRDPILCQIRNETECSICVLHRELLGCEVGLARQGGC